MAHGNGHLDCDLVGIGQLVLTEPAAWSNWPRVVDKLLQASDAAKIKKLMEGAVLESLHTWISYGKDRKDLVGVLRELGLTLLADSILEKQETGSCSAPAPATESSPVKLNPAFTKLREPKTDDRQIWDFICGMYGYPAILILHKLKIISSFSKGAKTVPDICAEFKLARRSTETLLNTAVVLGFLRRDCDRYHLTTLSEEYLLPNSENYFGHYLDLLIENHGSFSLPDLEKAVLSNSAYVYGAGESVYESHKQQSDRVVHFSLGMHSVSIACSMYWSRSLDLSHYHHMLDVGGGSGAHCIGTLSIWPNLCATVFDLPTVCEVARDFIANYQLTDRISTNPGDVWTDTFPEADLHFYSHVYHNWTPEKCAFLTRKSFGALPSGGRLVINEILYNDDKDGPLVSAGISMLMLAWMEGEQYSGAELRKMLEDAGFERVEIIPSFGYYSIVTGTKP